MRVLILLLCFGCFSCAASPRKAPIELSPIHQELEDLLWRGQNQEALELLQAHNWSLSGNVALERTRQDLRIQRGERHQVLHELQQWQQQHPESADVMYLRARLLEDPVGRHQHTCRR